jgi:hypothetical protein
MVPLSAAVLKVVVVVVSGCTKQDFVYAKGVVVAFSLPLQMLLAWKGAIMAKTITSLNIFFEL